MKKILALVVIVSITSGYSFAYEATDPVETIDTMVDNIDTTLTHFLSGIGSQTQQIVDDNVALYLDGYCVANNVLASTDIIYCGQYQGIAYILDEILENLVPDFGKIIDIDSIDIASIDKVQIIIEETKSQIEQEMNKLDRLSQIMNKALERPNLTDKQIFGIKYILFTLASIRDIFGLLPDFLENITDYIVEFHNTFGDVSLN